MIPNTIFTCLAIKLYDNMSLDNYDERNSSLFFDEGGLLLYLKGSPIFNGNIKKLNCN